MSGLHLSQRYKDWLFIQGEEHKEQDDDLISRQKAIFLADELKQDLPDDEHLTDMVMAHNEGILEYQTQLSLLQSVNPQEPKIGHWKRISIDKYSEHSKYWYRCDRCGKDNLGNTDWCPNCGARMAGSEDKG